MFLIVLADNVFAKSFSFSSFSRGINHRVLFNFYHCLPLFSLVISWAFLYFLILLNVYNAFDSNNWYVDNFIYFYIWSAFTKQICLLFSSDVSLLFHPILFGSNILCCVSIKTIWFNSKDFTSIGRGNLGIVQLIPQKNFWHEKNCQNAKFFW